MVGSRLVAATSAIRWALGEEDPGRGHEKRARARVSRRLKGPLDLASLSDLEREQRPSPLPGGRFGRQPIWAAGSIPEDRQQRRSRNELLEELESLSVSLHRLMAQPREIPARVAQTPDETLRPQDRRRRP